MDASFTVDSYAVAELLGFGTTGEVWRGRDEATGEPVAIKRLWEPLGPDRLTRLRREAAVVEEVGQRHVVALRDVCQLAGEEVALVMELAAGGSLAALIARRGRLHPSEVVTILGPLASVLAEAHERGLRHGDITPNNVVLAADGRPMLSDFGLALLTDEQPGEDTGFRDPVSAPDLTPRPASDVFGLAAVGFAALTGVPPRTADLTGRVPSVMELAPWVPAELASAVEAGLAPDAAARPDAARFAAAVLAATDAAPVRLGGPRRTPAAEEAEVSSTRTPHGKRSLVIVGLIAVAVVGGVSWAHRQAPAAAALHAELTDPLAVTGQPTASPTPAPNRAADYVPIVKHLFAVRAKALATCHRSLLRSIYPRVSSVFDMDHAAMDELCSQHFRALGFTQQIDRIVVEDFGMAFPGWARLWVEADVPAYTIVNRSGQVVARRASRTQRFEMNLDRQHGRWVISTLSPKSRPDPPPG